jgi:hypothetical protein
MHIKNDLKRTETSQAKVCMATPGSNTSYLRCNHPVRHGANSVWTCKKSFPTLYIRSNLLTAAVFFTCVIETLRGKPNIYIIEMRVDRLRSNQCVAFSL